MVKGTAAALSFVKVFLNIAEKHFKNHFIFKIGQLESLFWLPSRNHILSQILLIKIETMDRPEMITLVVKLLGAINQEVSANTDSL